MSAWLDPVRAALAERERPLRWFWRDDDGGWDDDALHALLDRFALHGATVDVAVIPAATSGASAARLRRRVRSGEARVHQHGWAHVDHGTEAKKCEFGAGRTTEAVRADLAAGRARMTDLFGAEDQPVFTPPWNRCSATTAECLRDLGVAVLSRESAAEPFALPRLVEVPVTFDWFGRRKGVAFDRALRAEVLASQVRERDVVGVMLHHAVTSADDLADIDALLALASASDAVQPTTIAAEAGRVSAPPARA